MNKTKDQSTAHAVRARVERGGADRLWTYADFAGLDRMAVAAALSRLARAGALTRVRRGVYYRPKTTLFGASRPDPDALVDAVLRARGEAPVRSGAGEYSRLGLTTQASGAVTRATSRRIQRGAVPGVRLHARARPSRRRKASGRRSARPSTRCAKSRAFRTPDPPACSGGSAP